MTGEIAANVSMTCWLYYPIETVNSSPGLFQGEYGSNVYYQPIVQHIYGKDNKKFVFHNAQTDSAGGTCTGCAWDKCLA